MHSNDLPSLLLAWLSTTSTTITGTSGNDDLAATAESQTLRGLGGHDTLSSSFDDTTLDGGAGSDTLTTSLVIEEPDFEIPDIDLSAVQHGRTGDDILDVRIQFLEVYVGVNVSVNLFGGAGNDTINVHTDFDMFGTAPSDAAIIHYVAAGDGDDSVTAFASTDFSGSGRTAANSIFGGDGNDFLSGFARVWSNSPDLALNHIVGGNHDDIIEAEVFTDSNSSIVTGRNLVYGGSGSDSISASHSTDGENWITFGETSIQGGAGNDIIVVDNLVTAESEASDLTTVSGSLGADTIDVSVTLSAFDLAEGTVTVLGGDHSDIIDVSTSSELAADQSLRNIVFGGNGAESITASASEDATQNFGTGFAENALDGGVGADVISGTVAVGSTGRSVLVGRSGHDRLSATGGEGNVFAGGFGDDSMTASTGADIFEFRNDLDEGTDRVGGWDPTSDALNVLGPGGSALADLGAPGYADDFDLFIDVTDDGTDVTLTFTSGTLVVLLGAGNGTSTSVADLVDDPATQLLSDPTLWTGAFA
ncbi:MAG TPA: hypothetical protein VFR34_11555 [Paracoccaceae bacterium]|nr:hypothetical protein [Paracoccaceae bacterium]